MFVAAAFGLGGCNWTGSLGGPERVAPISDEITEMRAYANSYADLFRGTAAEQMSARNNMIAARMYVIDIEYTQYEAQLMHEGQIVDFSTKVTSGVLTTTAGLIGNLGTSHALSETATLINGLDSAYNDKILKSQIIQNVLSSMRTARHDQAAIIYANMYCPTSVYPFGFALSDLETYYRAGTFQTGLIKLMQTTGKAESDARANQDNNKPAPSPDAQSKLQANATEADVKANTQTPAKKVAATNSLAAACKAPAGVDVSSYQPRVAGALAKRTVPAPTAVAGQSTPKAPL
ncbi:hypothetical protein FBZ93_1381 [Bradyrhizobium macuxiense]|uniref:Uncharacterized protein n=1 Tax=Bradyrhizobium macuxiense TaxID=1755647 RepID=A0A560KWX2_9BRAD|nr:hypothetical protein [Bradyrhizobium macuxiense]TWB85310.1 hypothetical protein FBZ93_1381 [Bradyrhizobium macuxiense]